MLTTYFYLIKSFSKMKKWSGTGAPTPFYAFLMLYFTNWPKSIAWLSLLLEILGNMCVVIICCPICDVISLGINLSFFIKPFFYITEKARQDQDRKELLTVSIFYYFYRAISCQKSYQTWEWAFNAQSILSHTCQIFLKR